MISPGKISAKKIIKAVGNVLAVVSLAFVVYQVVQKSEEIKNYFSIRILPVLVFSAVLCSLIVFVNSKVFTYILSLFTEKEVPFSSIAPIYIKTNLYKYLPGNVMHYVGRDQIAIMLGAEHSDILLASLVEICISAFSAVCAGMALSGKYIVSYIADTFDITAGGIILSGIIALFVLIVVFLCFKRSSFKKFLSNHFTKNNARILGKAFFINLLCSLTNGFVFTVLLSAFLYPNISASLFPAIAGISIIAWLIGFITPGAPGGLGVRELMLSIFLSSISGSDAIPACAIFYRIVTISGDIIAYLLSILLYRASNAEMLPEKEV